MKKYFSGLLVVLLIFAQIQYCQNEINQETANTIIASLLDSSASDQLTAKFQKGIRALPNRETVQIAAATATSASAPVQSVPRETTPVAVSRQPKSTVIQPTQAPTVVSNGTSQQIEMLAYINAARAQANLRPLVLNTKLSNGAYLKAQDMAAEGYFSHNSPTYGSMAEMMKNLDIAYRTAGENIAQNRSVQGAQEAFMNSPAHEANILNSNFNQVGLGFYQSGDDLYVTQWFTN